LAQYNIAKAKADLQSDIMTDFVHNLTAINHLADTSPGFVWRLQTDKGDATSIRPYTDRGLLITLSVWDSVEDLRRFTYCSTHRLFLRRRYEWFEPVDGRYLVLWWIPKGHLPEVSEAVSRLDLLRERGPSPQAFDFRYTFSPTDQEMVSHSDRAGRSRR
jgi:hypothetical protein